MFSLRKNVISAAINIIAKVPAIVISNLVGKVKHKTQNSKTQNTKHKNTKTQNTATTSSKRAPKSRWRPKRERTNGGTGRMYITRAHTHTHTHIITQPHNPHHTIHTTETNGRGKVDQP